MEGITEGIANRWREGEAREGETRKKEEEEEEGRGGVKEKKLEG